jgi:FixJ family two-component response regulator
MASQIETATGSGFTEPFPPRGNERERNRLTSRPSGQKGNVVICESQAINGCFDSADFRDVGARRMSPPSAAGQTSPQVSQTAVFVGDVESSTRTRLERLLATVGIPVQRIEAPDELTERVVQASTGCLVIDPARTGGNGRRWLLEPATAGRQLPTVCLSEQTSIASAVDAMRAGAWTCLVHSITDQELLEELQRAFEEDARRQTAAARVTAWRKMFAALSRREHEVFHHTVEGLTSKQVAKHLGITHRTVDAHRGNILRKLGINRLSEATLPHCALLASEEAAASRRMSLQSAK